ncbi:MAG: septal ring lytic transglycosylase RlpA family protein [Actinobacteria bacterium]|nr:septal ring lytic transglycosylase RlpA family protein [Actinomycetota bacterium]
MDGQPLTTGGRVLDLATLRAGPARKSKSSAGMHAILRLAITLFVMGGCAAYLHAQKQVTVADGDQTRTIQTFAPTVGDALKRAEISVGPNDRVSPDTDAPVPAGGEVEVMRAKDVVVVVNGERTQPTVTGRTVDDVLQELSVASQGALIYPETQAPVTPGDEIVVTEPVRATVVHDGQTREVDTNLRTAGGLLRQLGVVLGPHDRVEPSVVAYPSEGSTIKVVRVEKAVENIQSKIDFERRTERSDEVEMGIRKVKQSGTPGIRENSYQILYEDGKVKSRSLLDSKVVREPVPEIKLVGTKRPTLASSSQQQTGTASWYSMPGLMAAHKTLPFGTLVKVTNLDNGKSVTVTIRDRGPYVDGRIIDLSDTAFKQIAPIGRGVANVRIEW